MKVFVEGYADEHVVRALGVPPNQVRVEQGRDKVLERIRNLQNVIGMVDEDPGSHLNADLVNYAEVVSLREGLRLYRRHGSGGQRLIVLCPKLEDWLIRRARSSHVRIEDYSLPAHPDRLHSLPHYERRQGFRQFLCELVKQDDKGMRLLHEWLQHG